MADNVIVVKNTDNIVVIDQGSTASVTQATNAANAAQAAIAVVESVKDDVLQLEANVNATINSAVQSATETATTQAEIATTKATDAFTSKQAAAISEKNSKISETNAANSANLANLAAQAHADTAKTTLALLNADLAWTADKRALVTNDPISTNNGIYIKLGASGTGSWQKSAYIPEIINGSVTPIKTTFITRDTDYNLYDQNYMAGVAMIASGAQLSARTTGGIASAVYRIAVIKIDPNTQYSIIKELTNRFVAVTSSELYSFDNVFAITSVGGTCVVADAHVLTTNAALTNITFTSDANAQYLYIAYTEIGASCFMQIAKGLQTDFSVDVNTTPLWLNGLKVYRQKDTYNKQEVNSLVANSSLYKPMYAVYDSTTKTMTVMQQCKFDKSYYIGINFMHSIAGFNNCDCFRLDEMAIYKNTNGVFAKQYEGALLNGGQEWECALREKTASDFMGGRAHGAEVYTDVACVVDGTFVDLLTVSSFTKACNDIEIVTNSKLNRVGSPTDYVADHHKQIIFSPTDLIVSQKVKWLQSLTMSASFLCMFPVARRFGETTSATYGNTLPYITNKGFRDTDFAILDLAVNHSNFVYTNGVKSATLYNSGTGYQFKARVELLDSSNLPNNAMAISNAAQYNKMYFDHCGADYVTTIGEVWRNTAKYTIEYNGYV